MAEREQVRLKGEGGSEFVFDLPLPEAFAEQVRKRTLKPADDESAELLAQYASEGETEAASEPPPKTGKGSGKDAWASYALSQGLEITDEMSRDDIIAAVEAQEA